MTPQASSDGTSDATPDLRQTHVDTAERTTLSVTRATPAVVYRLYDVTGDLLYIGSTVNLAQRLTNHFAAPYQCGDPENLRARFHSLDTEYFEDVKDARYAEKIAIRDEGPALNRQGNPKRWRMEYPSMKYVQVTV